MYIASTGDECEEGYDFSLWSGLVLISNAACQSGLGLAGLDRRHPAMQSPQVVAPAHFFT